MIKPSLALLILLALSLPAHAQSDDTETPSFDLLRTVELRSHRSLMARIDAANGALSEFNTDGCSGGMSAGWSLVAEEFPDLAGTDDGDLPWTTCCVTHDRAYHNAGGTTEAEESYDARLAADDALRACVIATGEEYQELTMERLNLSAAQVDTGYRLLAQSMYNAVRLGGGPCSGLPWRWGYGFPKCWAFSR